MELRHEVIYFHFPAIINIHIFLATEGYRDIDNIFVIFIVNFSLLPLGKIEVIEKSIFKSFNVFVTF